MSVLALLLQHIEEPTPTTLDALRRAVVEDETFDAATGWYPRVEALVAADRHDEAIRRIDAHMPGAFCCPQAHALLAQSLAAIGRDEDATRPGRCTSHSRSTASSSSTSPTTFSRTRSPAARPSAMRRTSRSGASRATSTSGSTATRFPRARHSSNPTGRPPTFVSEGSRRATGE